MYDVSNAFCLMFFLITGTKHQVSRLSTVVLTILRVSNVHGGNKLEASSRFICSILQILQINQRTQVDGSYTYRTISGCASIFNSDNYSSTLIFFRTRAITPTHAKRPTRPLNIWNHIIISNQASEGEILIRHGIQASKPGNSYVIRPRKSQASKRTRSRALSSHPRAEPIYVGPRSLQLAPLPVQCLPFVFQGCLRC